MDENTNKSSKSGEALHKAIVASQIEADAHKAEYLKTPRKWPVKVRDCALMIIDGKTKEDICTALEWKESSYRTITTNQAFKKWLTDLTLLKENEYRAGLYHIVQRALNQRIAENGVATKKDLLDIVKAMTDLRKAQGVTNIKIDVKEGDVDITLTPQEIDAVVDEMVSTGRKELTNGSDSNGSGQNDSGGVPEAKPVPAGEEVL